MPSCRNAPLIFLRQAGYRDAMLPFLSPEPAPLIQAAATDSVMVALASIPNDLMARKERHIVMLRGRRRLLLLENGSLRQAFPVAIGMPGWETPTGTSKFCRRSAIPCGFIR